MSEEDYLASRGYGFMGYADVALHRQPGSSEASRSRLADRQQRNAEQHDLIREELRAEYRRLVDSGEIEPPTRLDRLRARASGDPGMESVQAARRLLAKMGASQ